MAVAEKDDLRPLIKQWLEKWEEEASASSSKMKYVYRNALKSLKQHPDPVTSSRSCGKLKFFGEKLCGKIEKALQGHYGALGRSPPKPTPAKDPKPLKTSKEGTSSQNGKGITRSYLPKPNSGGFAILVALFKAETEEDLSPVAKSELIERAQAYSSESMTASKVGSHYTAWNSMKTLIKRGLVESEHRRQAFFSLTDSGHELALKLHSFLTNGSVPATTNRKPKSNGSKSKSKDAQFDNSGDEDDNEILEVEVEPSQASKANSTETFSRFLLSAGEFEIVLLVDSREQTSGVASNMKKTALVAELIKRGLVVEMRTLPVGDFAWIARRKANALTSYQSKVQELVLDVVMERKRVDDLEGSVKDGRWHEQKYRLKNSGIRQPTYLIEGLDPRKNYYGIPYRNLHQAVTNAQIIDGFNVKFTKDYEETVNLLVTMTKYFSKSITKKDLRSCSKEEVINGEAGITRQHLITFAEFERTSRKITNFTVTEMFLKQLLQFKGVSLAKAKAITDRFKTINELRDAYRHCAKIREREFLLSQIKFGDNDRKIGPAVSKMIYSYYSDDIFQSPSTSSSSTF